MSKDKKAGKKAEELWDGENYSFPKFDREVRNYARTKWGEEIGTLLWENGFPEGLFEVPETVDEWANHCWMVHRHFVLTDFKTSQLLKAPTEFWTHEFQHGWLQRQYELLYSEVESRVKGGAETQVVNVGAKNPWGVRAALKKKYDNARTVKLSKRQLLYDLGMPEIDEAGNPLGPAFEERTGLIEKSQQLEGERNELYQVCPERFRDTYKYGKESHLVRVVSEKIHTSYSEVVRSVNTVHRLRQEGGLEAGLDIDLHEHQFSDKHLPPWKELKGALIEKYGANNLPRKMYP